MPSGNIYDALRKHFEPVLGAARTEGSLEDHPDDGPQLCGALLRESEQFRPDEDGVLFMNDSILIKKGSDRAVSASGRDVCRIKSRALLLGQCPNHILQARPIDHCVWVGAERPWRCPCCNWCLSTTYNSEE